MTREHLDKIKSAKNEAKKLTAGKEFKKLSTKEKDTLLETLCKMFGLL